MSTAVSHSPGCITLMACATASTKIRRHSDSSLVVIRAALNSLAIFRDINVVSGFFGWDGPFTDSRMYTVAPPRNNWRTWEASVAQLRRRNGSTSNTGQHGLIRPQHDFAYSIIRSCQYLRAAVTIWFFFGFNLIWRYREPNKQCCGTSGGDILVPRSIPRFNFETIFPTLHFPTPNLSAYNTMGTCWQFPQFLAPSRHASPATYSSSSNFFLNKLDWYGMHAAVLHRMCSSICSIIITHPRMILCSGTSEASYKRTCLLFEASLRLIQHSLRNSQELRKLKNYIAVASVLSLASSEPLRGIDHFFIRVLSLKSPNTFKLSSSMLAPSFACPGILDQDVRVVFFSLIPFSILTSTDQTYPPPYGASSSNSPGPLTTGPATTSLPSFTMALNSTVRKTKTIFSTTVISATPPPRFSSFSASASSSVNAFTTCSISDGGIVECTNIPLSIRTSSKIPFWDTDMFTVQTTPRPSTSTDAVPTSFPVNTTSSFIILSTAPLTTAPLTTGSSYSSSASAIPPFPNSTVSSGSSSGGTASSSSLKPLSTLTQALNATTSSGYGVPLSTGTPLSWSVFSKNATSTLPDTVSQTPWSNSNINTASSSTSGMVPVTSESNTGVTTTSSIVPVTSGSNTNTTTMSSFSSTVTEATSTIYSNSSTVVPTPSTSLERCTLPGGCSSTATPSCTLPGGCSSTLTPNCTLSGCSSTVTLSCTLPGDCSSSTTLSTSSGNPSTMTPTSSLTSSERPTSQVLTPPISTITVIVSTSVISSTEGPLSRTSSSGSSSTVTPSITSSESSSAEIPTSRCTLSGCSSTSAPGSTSSESSATSVLSSTSFRTSSTKSPTPAYSSSTLLSLASDSSTVLPSTESDLTTWSIPDTAPWTSQSSTTWTTTDAVPTSFPVSTGSSGAGYPSESSFSSLSSTSTDAVPTSFPVSAPTSTISGNTASDIVTPTSYPATTLLTSASSTLTYGYTPPKYLPVVTEEMKEMEKKEQRNTLNDADLVVAGYVVHWSTLGDIDDDEDGKNSMLTQGILKM
ncbi:uncharacterized protein BDR25DRAFT_355484 [Lindgomyces ingoldianus]|uniref:Uncharacterized protein n=1 Tax=Lindgomyces ingoldianus TaxID=673940 RepID=A0ACB6QU10_9PLEO|nr:uncharacterized protein BDR25DRAFT_355484 [Lindgomyces ingoldianus]KAF2470370.1 hypothetical protein BDR25DRAFT_355484 [Lindgomyces ingoldianus]